MGQRNFKRHFKFHNFSDIFYCFITRLRNRNLSIFIQCQCTREIKNMGQSLFKKHSKFQKIDQILYSVMTRFRNVKLGAFRQYKTTKTILKKYGTELF